MLVVTSALCALATLGLIAAEWRGARRWRAIAKITASTAFVATGVLAANGRSDGYACALIVGLVLGAIGDVCLLGDSQGAFLAGLGTFLLGHIAYVVALAQVSAPSAWFGLAGPAAALPIAIGAIALVAKLAVLGVALAVFEVFTAKIRLFRVPELLAVSFVVAFLAVTAAAFLG